MAASAPPAGTSMNAREKAWLAGAYNLGRLATYLVFGLIAGLLGLFVDFSGSLVGLQQTAILFAGGLLILFGLMGLLRNFGIRLEHIQSSQLISRFLQRRIKSVAKFPPTMRSFSIGLFTSLMPCGWLYFFVIAASTTQSLVYAPLVMLVFWLGTVPVLLSIGLVTSGVLNQLKRKANWIIPVMMLMIGFTTIYFRGPVKPDTEKFDSSNQASATIFTTTPTQVPCCCDDQS